MTNKFAAKSLKVFHPTWIVLHYLVKLEMLIAHVLPLSCYRKKLQNLSHLSSVTSAGVTWCGNWWCHLFFTSKSDDFLVIVVENDDHFRHRQTATLSTFRGNHLSGVLVNSATKIFWISLGCHLPDDVTRGGPPPQRRHCLTSKVASKFAKFESRWLQRVGLLQNTHHWFGWTETATKSEVGQAGSFRHCGGHSSAASSIAPDQWCVFCASSLAIFPHTVINWIQIWQILRPHLKWDKFWSFFLSQPNGSTWAMSILSFTK